MTQKTRDPDLLSEWSSRVITSSTQYDLSLDRTVWHEPIWHEPINIFSFTLKIKYWCIMNWTSPKQYSYVPSWNLLYYSPSCGWETVYQTGALCSLLVIHPCSSRWMFGFKRSVYVWACNPTGLQTRFVFGGWLWCLDKQVGSECRSEARSVYLTALSGDSLWTRLLTFSLTDCCIMETKKIPPAAESQTHKWLLFCGDGGL